MLIHLGSQFIPYFSLHQARLIIMMICLVLFTAVLFGLKQKTESEKELQLMLKREIEVCLPSSATSVSISVS